MNPLELKVKISVEYKISFWQAIKLRIAGKAYQEITKEIIKQIKKKFAKEIK
jgi:hypothetical protein